jgi:3-oxoacyl-[acyl-carrier-protein] synthase II
MKRVVITGMDLITALGASLACVWPRLMAGENGVGPITYFDASEYSCRVAAEVRNAPVPRTGLESVPLEHCRRGVRLFLQVVRGAWADAGLGERSVPPERVGVAAGTSVNYANIGLIRQYYRFRRGGAGQGVDVERFGREGCQPAHIFYRRVGDMTAAVPARAMGFSGPTLAIDTACAASSFAIGEAFRLVQRGRATAMVAGGASSLVSPITLLAFSVLGALTRQGSPDEASRPFDRDRDGFVIGEGAGAIVLEEYEHARARGARIYAELSGYGTTISAQNLTDPSPSGECEERAMRLALDDGRIPPDRVGFIAAHGTSTPKNDATEATAIRRLFGPRSRQLSVSSNKGQIGHTISAAGVCNVICAVQAVYRGELAPTAHYRTPDPDCDLEIVPNVGRRAKVQAALANAFAFAGQNAALAVQAV